MFGRWWKGARGAREVEADPGPSPVAWLSDEIWRSWNAGIADAAQEKTGHPIRDVWPRLVTEDDRRRCPAAPVPAGAPVPPSGTLAEHASLLQSTPGVGFMNLVLWPVCCDRLTTLLHPRIEVLESHVGPLDAVLTEAHYESPEQRPSIDRGWVGTLAKMRAGKHGGDGLAFFQCRACGRVYGAFCEP